jgi:hypothetical protein
MSHIFISYSKKNKDYANALAEYLQAQGFNIWIDRIGIEYGVDWWDAIVEGLRECGAFIVVMTPESKASDWVKREVGLALHWRKPVFPLLLNGDNWELFVLTQFADVSDGSLPDGDLIARLGAHVTARGKGVNKSNLTPEAQAAHPLTPAPPEARFNVDVAINEFGTAYRARNWSEALNSLGRIRASGEDPSPFDPDVLEQRIQDAIEAENRTREQQAWLAERERHYNRLHTIASYADSETVWKALQKFWTVFPEYDPDDLAADARPKPVQRILTPSSKLMPAPFAWIDIPGTIGKKWTGAPYQISKYPVTNAQFKLFVDAGGYDEPRWWTEAGWGQREKEKWTEPRYWRDKQWNGAEKPVVGVSWYEAVAFCLWLSETTGESIMLPTDEQWQYAAQGDDGRAYPWGNNWDCKKCNNSVKPCDSNVTTPVRQYEGKGDSPFKVVDMAGNVGEWCVTDYNHNTHDINSHAEYRVLRGGSWSNNLTDLFRCDDRNRYTPHYGDYDGGCRLALSY